MANKTDVEINLSEVLVHLRDSGAFRNAVMKVAEAKAGGGEIGNITLNRSGGELSDDDLKSVAGGASLARAGTIPEVSQFRYEAPGGGMGGGQLAGFADTTW